MSERVIIIDGLNMFLRSYIVVPQLSKEGQPIGGTTGFLKSLQKLCREMKPTQVVVCWDGRGGSRKRKQQNKNYKEGRAPIRLNRNFKVLTEDQEKENKIWQQERICEYLNNFPVMQLIADEVEADDIISYLCRYSSLRDRQKIIVSSDKDFFQLCDSMTAIYRPIQDVLETEGTITHRFGIHPNNFALARAIAGDSSDNLKGVSRVGLKTVAKNFSFLGESKQYTSEDIFEICETIDKPKAVHKNIIAQRDLVDQNYQIMQLYNPSIPLINKSSIDYILANFDLESNKLNFKKMLFSDGQGSLNFTDLWNNFKNLSR